MASEKWPLVPLGQLIENFDALRVPVKQADRVPGPYPYYGASGIVDWVDDFIFDGEYLLVAEDGENLRTRNTPVAFIATGRFWVNNHAHIVRANNDADTRYLMYALQTADIGAYLTGSTMPKLTQANLDRIPIVAPPLPEQRAIAHILGTLDDKIDLNRRMNETLEAMARALFKSWFVDFDPVRAKAEGRDPGLPQQIADLFPDSFEDSELGEIPRGWRIAPLGDHIEVVRGLSYKGSGLADAGIPLHNLNSIHEGGGYKDEGIKYYTEAYDERHLVKPGDVIVANTEQGHDRLLIGYAAIVPSFYGDRGLASHHVYRLRPTNDTPMTSAFLCQLLNSPRMQGIVSGYANGTTVNMLPMDAVQQPQIVVPPRELAMKFDEFARQMESRREEMVAESRTLAALRDTLLPKLISGEVRVTEVEKQSGEGRI